MSDLIPRSHCRGCGKEIVWGLDEEDKPIPLDPRPPIYEVRMAGGKARCERMRETMNQNLERGGVPMVSHFATCSHANDFSRGKKS